MNKDMQDKLRILEGMIGIQTDFSRDDYNHGLLNGMILAHSVIDNCSPKIKISKKKKEN